MATASTINDTMPTPWDGKKRWNGKKNPVTFVSTVVTRNSAVQASRRFVASKPNTTTNPDKIPIKLNATCTKVSVVTPKIMMPPQPETHLGDPADPEDTIDRLQAQFSRALAEAGSGGLCGMTWPVIPCMTSLYKMGARRSMRRRA